MERAIFQAAEQLFLEKGYAQTSTVEIAKRAGCNQTLVHYYFRSKENLFQQIFAEKFRGVIQGLLRIDAEELPFEQTIARVIESHFDVLAANPRLPFLMLSEVSTNPKRLEAIKAMLTQHIPDGVIGKLQMRLHEAIERGSIRPLTIVDILITAVSLNLTLFLVRPVVMSVLQMNNEQFDDLVKHRRRENVEIVLRSLRP